MIPMTADNWLTLAEILVVFAAFVPLHIGYTRNKPILVLAGGLMIFAVVWAKIHINPEIPLIPNPVIGTP